MSDAQGCLSIPVSRRHRRIRIGDHAPSYRQVCSVETPAVHCEIPFISRVRSYSSGGVLRLATLVRPPRVGSGRSIPLGACEVQAARRTGDRRRQGRLWYTPRGCGCVSLHVGMSRDKSMCAPAVHVLIETMRLRFQWRSLLRMLSGGKGSQLCLTSVGSCAKRRGVADHCCGAAFVALHSHRMI